MSRKRQAEEDAPRPQRAAAAAASQAWRAPEEAPDLFFSSLTQPAEAGIIWLHGLDDMPESWARTLEPARRRHPKWHWTFLRAPERAIRAYDGMRHTA